MLMMQVRRLRRFEDLLLDLGKLGGEVGGGGANSLLASLLGEDGLQAAKHGAHATLPAAQPVGHAQAVQVEGIRG